MAGSSEHGDKYWWKSLSAKRLSASAEGDRAELCPSVRNIPGRAAGSKT